MKRFDSPTVIVTVGARGMGASHARGFVIRVRPTPSPVAASMAAP